MRQRLEGWALAFAAEMRWLVLTVVVPEKLGTSPHWGANQRALT